MLSISTARAAAWVPLERLVHVVSSTATNRASTQVDAYNALQWQLAENHSDTSTNPFVPLLHCYRAGAYPFSLDRDTVVLFRFADGDRFAFDVSARA